jgi:hypothetical protein
MCVKRKVRFPPDVANIYRENEQRAVRIGDLVNPFVRFRTVGITHTPILVLPSEFVECPFLVSHLSTKILARFLFIP